MDRILMRRALLRWSAHADAAPTLQAEDLRRLKGSARLLRAALDRVIHQADYRLGLPVIGPGTPRRLPGTDWAWRPDLWQGPIPVPGIAPMPSRAPLSEGVTLFHDCRLAELSARQIRNGAAEDLAPFGLCLDVFHFDGSFLSLVLDLPPEATSELKLRHLIRLDARVEMEKPLNIFVRLNIKHGPNVEQLVRELPLSGPDGTVEFDLAYTRVNEKRIEKLWIDLIFEAPQLNQITLRDLMVSRRPRAEV